MSFAKLLLRLALGRRLPITAGELRVKGPTAPITIRRDKYGVPHIDAACEGDAAFGLGFCQGQDRAGQLEFLLRTARGQLSEWVGSAALTVDRVSRRIGFHRSAAKQLEANGEPCRQQIVSFAAGVSAGISSGLPAKPHEFAILGGQPTPWEPYDVLAVLKLQSFVLPSNWDVELARLRILFADGPEALLALDPVLATAGKSDGGLLPQSPLEHVAAALSADLSALQAHLGRGGGSNNWIIAGSRTISGKPLLASDPHLAPSAPPPWYVAHLRTPDSEAMGAGLAGSPGLAIGHNGFAAWGVTAGLTDNTDLFVETLSPDGSSTREADGTWKACEVVRETIRVRGQPDVLEDVKLTSRGPVISPLGGMPYAISLRAIWLDPLPIDGFLEAPRERSYEGFRKHFADWPLLPLNVLYADASGDMGWFLSGQLPVRAGGNGLLPRPADLRDSGWSGLVPLEKMPCRRNPERGYWATANNDPGMSADSPWLGADYCDPYRVRVILDALGSREHWTLEDCQALQRDLRSIPWEEIRDVVLALPAADSDAQDGQALLRSWDGRIDAESPAATVFELFLAGMCSRVAAQKAPRSSGAALGEGGAWEGSLNLFADRRVRHLVQLIREQPDGWFPSWTNTMLEVLSEVVRRLRLSVGPGPAYWTWGYLRQLRLDHPLFGKHRWLGPIFNLGPVPIGGDCNTVSQAGSRPGNPTDFTHNMCNFRAVFDLNDLPRSRFVLCGGQSGNPWSPHHADQFPLWQAGEAITIPWDQAAVIREAVQTLRLLPE